jgi:hypothetical protein
VHADGEDDAGRPPSFAGYPGQLGSRPVTDYPVADFPHANRRPLVADHEQPDRQAAVVIRGRQGGHALNLPTKPRQLGLPDVAAVEQALRERPPARAQIPARGIDNRPDNRPLPGVSFQSAAH